MSAKKAKQKKKDKATDAPGYLPIDGIAPKTYPAVDKLCVNYLAAEAKTNKARLEKKEKHLLLLEAMKERELKNYRHEDSGKVFYQDLTESIKHKELSKADDSEKNGINPKDENDEDGGEVELESPSAEEEQPA